MKPDIIVANPFSAELTAALERDFTLHLLWEAEDEAAFLAGPAGQARGIVTFGTPVTTAMIAALPQLQIIAAMSVGFDHIDLAAARARSIPVTHAPDVLTDDVADLAVTLMLCVARRIVVEDRFLRAGGWLTQPPQLAAKLGGAAVGILGLGRIGLAIAQRAEAFGTRIAYHGPRRKPEVSYRYFDDLVAMAREVDYLIVSCPGGPKTRNLVDAAVIAALGPEGAIINIARGSVIDEPALVKALVEKKLGGAGLDVFVDEPKVPEALLGLDTVVLTPHVGSATHATRRAMGQLMLDNLLAHFAGKPLLTRCA
jgi:lactate dehydrogenase-like 2-hydroxyacid dehydrogenase